MFHSCSIPYLATKKFKVNEIVPQGEKCCPIIIPWQLGHSFCHIRNMIFSSFWMIVTGYFELKCLSLHKYHGYSTKVIKKQFKYFIKCVIWVTYVTKIWCINIWIKVTSSAVFFSNALSYSCKMKTKIVWTYKNVINCFQLTYCSV